MFNQKMMQKMEKETRDEELQSRRDFFRKTAKKALPILGVALFGTTLLTSCGGDDDEPDEPSKPQGCNGCSGSCSNSCSGSCDESCSAACAFNCGSSQYYG